jgi:hypothetical protein
VCVYGCGAQHKTLEMEHDYDLPREELPGVNIQINTALVRYHTRPTHKRTRYGIQASHLDDTPSRQNPCIGRHSRRTSPSSQAPPPPLPHPLSHHDDTDTSPQLTAPP